MSNSSRLALPFLAAGQAQKHVTVNESLLRLDALVQLSVVSASLTEEPADPGDGDIYMLPAGKSGAAWDEMSEGALAYYRDGAWEEITPREGWRAWVCDTNKLLLWNDSAWASVRAENSRKLLFTPGGEGVVSIYRIDTARAQNPRTALIDSVAGDVITLASADAGLFFSQTSMAGVSYARIWNTSKDPDESAWVKASAAGDELQVTNAAHIAGWANGETVQIGDPEAVTPGRVIALDISPMLQIVLGRVFPQSGVLCKMLATGIAAQAAFGVTASGISGTFQTLRSLADGSLIEGQMIIPCTQLSPISNSNLVFVRETATGSTLAANGASVMGVFV